MNWGKTNLIQIYVQIYIQQFLILIEFAWAFFVLSNR